MAIQVQQEAAPGTWEAEAATWGGCGIQLLVGLEAKMLSKFGDGARTMMIHDDTCTRVI